jgi:RNA polymerase sigma-70 factor (ECF subfamily)
MRPAGKGRALGSAPFQGAGLEDDVDQWFAREILPLEAMLDRYLRRSWRDQWEVPDLRQDAYVRVYEAALREKPFNAKHFLFQVARNLMIDRSRRKNVVSFDSFADFDGMEADDDRPDAEQSAAARQEVQLLMTAIGELPPRCREVVTLRKIEGLSQREVARKMGITEDTVERQVSNGVRLLRKLLHPSGASVSPDVRPRLGRLKVFSK